jgi:hypothetical protein
VVLLNNGLMQKSSRTQPSLRNYKDVQGMSWQEGADWNEVRVDWWTAIPVILAFIMSSVALGFGISGFVIGKDLQSDMTNVTKNFTTIQNELDHAKNKAQDAHDAVKPLKLDECMHPSTKRMNIYGSDQDTTLYTGDYNPTRVPAYASRQVFRLPSAPTCSMTQSAIAATVAPGLESDSFANSMELSEIDGCLKMVANQFPSYSGGNHEAHVNCDATSQKVSTSLYGTMKRHYDPTTQKVTYTSTDASGCFKFDDTTGALIPMATEEVFTCDAKTGKWIACFGVVYDNKKNMFCTEQ